MQLDALPSRTKTLPLHHDRLCAIAVRYDVHRKEVVSDLRTMVGALKKNKSMASTEAVTVKGTGRDLPEMMKLNSAQRIGSTSMDYFKQPHTSKAETKNTKPNPDHKVHQEEATASHVSKVEKLVGIKSTGNGNQLRTSVDDLTSATRTGKISDTAHEVAPGTGPVPTGRGSDHGRLTSSTTDRASKDFSDVRPRTSAKKSSTPTPLSRRSFTPPLMDYKVGWICALPFEAAAAETMLDNQYPDLPLDPYSSTLYTLGRVGPHNVVIACLPRGRPGLSAASVVARGMLERFRGIRFGFLVGIGGGVPSDRDDIRLGDVVVSQPNLEHGGVVQYDFGKAEEGGVFRRTGHLNSPPALLLSVLNRVQINHERGRRTYPIHMARYEEEDMQEYLFPQDERDTLFRADYPHPTGTLDCTSCNSKQTIQRPARNTKQTTVKIHYGTIASGNQVIKDAQTRDRIVKDLGGQVLCFKMEAAGLMNDFPCLVVRGISDYCDSHKNDGWQRYAAASAAAYTRELLLLIPPEDVVK
jgi:nucleoside phosphorylase